MAKYTQKICRQQATSCLIVFDHFVGLELSTKKKKKKKKSSQKFSRELYEFFQCSYYEKHCEQEGYLRPRNHLRYKCFRKKQHLAAKYFRKKDSIAGVSQGSK